MVLRFQKTHGTTSKRLSMTSSTTTPQPFLSALKLKSRFFPETPLRHQPTLSKLSPTVSIPIQTAYATYTDFIRPDLAPLTKTHAWGTLTPEQWLQLPFLSEIVLALEDMGIEVQQFHAESGPGQYEFVLPPHPPLLAIDTLLQARQVIAQIASLHGLRATLHPKPFEGIGTAAHAHISLHPPERDMQFFVGGVLKHLPAICAFSMPEEISYERVTENSWTGGTWVRSLFCALMIPTAPSPHCLDV